MPPFLREGDLRVIRPLVYVREVHLRAFADSVHLPVIAENCPACFEAPKVMSFRVAVVDVILHDCVCTRRGIV